MKLYTFNLGMLHQWLPPKLLLIVKLIIIIMTTVLLQVSAASFAQKFSLTTTKESLKNVFAEIQKQTGFTVLAKSEYLNNSKPITISLKNVPVEDALTKILAGQNLSFTIEDKVVLIKEAEPGFLDRVSDAVRSVFKDVIVKGKVTDQDGIALPNASIRVKGKSVVTNTNQNGEFEIKGVDEDAVLLVSYVGFKTLEIGLKDAVMPLEIKLNVATGELEEVKVTYNTGYQTIDKTRATGSFVQIDNELFNRAVSTNVLDRILEITNSLKVDKAVAASKENGSPISIRGFSTINANMKPLIVVDGFPYEEEAPQRGQINLNNLNPNDVESITILRDAAAASIWGARSGNGVIVITTKKGKFNQPISINFSNSVNITEKPRLDKMNVIKSVDAIEFEKRQFATGIYNQYDDAYPVFDLFPAQSPAIELMLAARKKNSGIAGYNALNDPDVLAKLSEMGSHDVRDDVSKYLLQTGVNQQYAINLSGGADKINYYSSVGYDKNLALNRGTNDNRLTLNFKTSYKPIKRLVLNTYLYYTKQKSANNAIGYQQFLPGRTATYTRLADDQGNALHVVPGMGSLRTAYIDTAKYPALLDWHYRPIDEIENNDNTSNSYSTRFGGDINYELFSGLRLSLISQYDKSLSRTDNYQNLKNYNTRDLINLFMQRGANGAITYPVPLGGILDYSNQESTKWNVRGVLSFAKTWGKHQLNALASAEAEQKTSNDNAGRYYGYIANTNTLNGNVDFVTNFPTRASGGSINTIINPISIGGTLNRFTSYSANTGYTFDNKYTITASGRIDASNFFGSKANQRITPLWSLGILWDITKENFYDLKAMSVLKLRATYGYTANLNNKATGLPTGKYDVARHGYNNEIYINLLTPPNPGLTWEKVGTMNIGIDYGLFNQRIGGSIDYYVKKGINLIGPKLIEATVGVSSYTGNYASMISKGFDFNIRTNNFGGKFKWGTNFNLSYNADKVIDYEITEEDQNATGTIADNIGHLIVGKPLFKLYSYPSAGLDPLNGKPRGYVNGEIVPFNQVLEYYLPSGAKPSDLIYHGSATPQIFGYVMNDLSYKNISLSFNISYSLNYFVKRASVDYSSLFSNVGVSAHGDYYLRWQKPGDENKTKVPSLSNNLDGSYAFYSNSSDLVIKGDNIRLNDLVLSYNLNKSVIKQLPFSNARLSVVASNLGIILWRANKYGVDPNIPNDIQPPISRNIALRLNINF
jgi:TonB-linked SusC/RagA family outer membrane protein